MGDDQLMMKYHDDEWGVPVHDDKLHFEYIILDAFQAGLSWKTVLYKRENFRRAFDDFDIEKVAKYDESKIQELLQDKSIIRNCQKIQAAVKNANALKKIQDTFGSFDDYVWRFVDGRPIVNRWESLAQIPPKSPESDAMSKDLKKRGFGFVGSTICYAYMQAAGMVNDHTISCFRHNEVIARH